MAITKYIFGKKNDLDSLIFNSSFKKSDFPNFYDKLCQYTCTLKKSRSSAIVNAVCYVF